MWKKTTIPVRVTACSDTTLVMFAGMGEPVVPPVLLLEVDVDVEVEVELVDVDEVPVVLVLVAVELVEVVLVDVELVPVVPVVELVLVDEVPVVVEAVPVLVEAAPVVLARLGITVTVVASVAVRSPLETVSWNTKSVMAVTLGATKLTCAWVVSPRSTDGPLVCAH